MNTGTISRRFGAPLLLGLATGSALGAPNGTPPGTVRLAANHAFISGVTDLGVVDDAHFFPHVLLGLKRAPERQRALDSLVADQQTASSPRYHKWITAAELQRFAPDASQTARVIGWLREQRLIVNGVSPSGMTVDFGGSAGSIAAAFHTSLHNVTYRGRPYVINQTDPAIPVSLAPAIDGITLSNVFPRPNVLPKSSVTVPQPNGTPFYFVGPADFQTIYNVTPLIEETGVFPQPITGAAVTIAAVEQSDILQRDWLRFRQYFNLWSYTGTLSTLHPGHCGDPGRTGDETEAALDVEWAGANAPDAAVVEASCPATETTFGVMTSLRNLVETEATNATIYTISYGGCEQQNGLPFLTMWTNLVEEGAAEGKSIVVSSGDSGSSCDRNEIDADGLGVNGLAASAYVTSVGGTDFSDAATNQLKRYWGHPTGADDGHGSALSYVPEIPWDNSCASSFNAAYFGAPSGLAFCDTNPYQVQNGVGGTGGASLYFAKPSWQKIGVPGVPRDGVRDQPDVSLFAANGYWDHATLICMSDQEEGGSPCVYDADGAIHQAVGGTSVSAPAFGGILALITQIKQAPLGNPAPRLYQIAKLQFTNPVLAKSCNASLGRDISKGCVFNNVTAGDNAEPCYGGTRDCHVAKPSDYVGVLSEHDGASPVAAFPAGQGYNLATGLGSLNVNLLAESY